MKSLENPILGVGMPVWVAIDCVPKYPVIHVFQNFNKEKKALEAWENFGMLILHR